MATDGIPQLTFDFQQKLMVARFDQAHTSTDGGLVLLTGLDAQPSATLDSHSQDRSVAMEKLYTHLNQSEREELSRCLATGMSGRTMAQHLTRSPSTISREIARTAASVSTYRATQAQGRSRRRACEPRRPRKLTDSWLADYVQAGLLVGWSPQQIAARLKRDYPSDYGQTHLA
jgi:transposase